MENALETFRGSEVKIITEEKKYLGAAIGSEDFKASYVKSLIDNWIDQLNLLSKRAESEPQSASLAFVGENNIMYKGLFDDTGRGNLF